MHSVGATPPSLAVSPDNGPISVVRPAGGSLPPSTARTGQSDDSNLTIPDVIVAQFAYEAAACGVTRARALAVLFAAVFLATFFAATFLVAAFFAAAGGAF